MPNVHFTDDDLKGDGHSSGESSGSVATRAAVGSADGAGDVSIGNFTLDTMRGHGRRAA